MKVFYHNTLPKLLVKITFVDLCGKVIDDRKIVISTVFLEIRQYPQGAQSLIFTAFF